ncbi:restriction endonuclease subunit S [Micrococcus endophyticus]|uniref:restriction endonuclease subunit S n=1 Tax=Micrococcus endophyticus TaxID=455343 RepID=UPI002006AEC6|nr:restriction endonuclease subunit S [Micrococcus endophyticus]
MSWRTTTWGEVIRLHYGKALVGGSVDSGPVRVYGTNGPTGFTDAEPQGTGPSVVVGRKGAYRGIHYAPEPFFVIDTAFYVESLEGVDMRWVYYALKTVDLDAIATGSAIPSTRREDLYEVKVRLPPRREQQAIGEVLGALDDKIAANHRLQSLAIDQISALARAAAGTVRLGEVASLHRNSLAPGSFGAENVWHYSLPSFDEGKVRLEGSSGIMSAKHRLDRPVVLVSKLNPRIPRVWPVMRLKEGVSVTSPEFMAMAPTQGFSVASLTAALRSEQFTTSLLSLVAGTTGSHQRVKPMEVMELGIPDMRTLSRAALETIEALELMSVSSSEENTTLTTIRDELLPQLMSGRITVKDAERRVEEEI